MKQVTFQGCMYSVPDGANYITKDRDGDIYAFNSQPKYKIEIGEWYTATGQCWFIANHDCMEIL